MQRPMATVFATADQSRFFLLPADAELAEGDTTLRNLRGEERAVDLEAAAAFEVSEDEAKIHVQEEIRGYARRAGSFLTGALKALRDVGRSQEMRDVTEQVEQAMDEVTHAAETTASAAASEVQRSPATEQVADALGLKPEDLGDPEKVLGGLRDAGEGLRRLIAEQLDGATTEGSPVRDRLDAISESARTHFGPELGDLVAGLPDALGGLLNDPELEGKLQSATEDLQRATEELRRATEADDAAETDDEAPSTRPS